jgi:SSS family transporter
MLDTLDYAALAAYLLIVGWIGFRAGRGERTTRDYFLASRTIPWWAAGVSIIATETSALTFIGAPVQSLRGDWTYLQLAIGSVLARFVVGGLLIRAYYRTECTTVYDYLAQRFGVMSRLAGSLLFLVGRLLGSGVRLYAGAIALVIVADMSFPIAISLIAVLAVAYTTHGGIRAVIWTDLFQAILLVGGGALALGYLVDSSGLGFFGMMEAVAAEQTAAGHSKLRLLSFSLSPTEANTIFAGVIGSAFLTMSTHGTDHDMAQRALTTRDEHGGRRSMWLSAALNIPIAALFLCIGSALFWHLGGAAGAESYAAKIAAEHAANGVRSTAQAFDFVFPYFVVESLPSGVRGLILAGVFATSMSSLDSAISALSSAGVVNLWQPHVAPNRDPEHYMRVSRYMAAGFGGVLVAIALVVWLGETGGSAREGFGVLILGLRVLTWIFPPLLGIFLLGVLTRRGTDLGNLVALTVGVGVLLAISFMPQPPFAWTWNSLVGCAISFGLGALFAPLSTVAVGAQGAAAADEAQLTPITAASMSPVAPR